MDKVTDFLEKHVQWIAVGIGGLVFLFALWAYWIQPDLTVTVRNRKVGPGDVDEALLVGPVADLRNHINNPMVPSAPPVDLTSRISEEVDIQGYNPPALPSTLLAHVPDPNRPPQVRISDDFAPGLPVPPPAAQWRLASGRSFARMPAAGAPQNIAEVDIAEVRVDFEIPMVELGTAFREAALPPEQQVTSMLRVRLMRQRKLPDGAWGEDAEVPLLVNNPLAARPMPGPEAPIEEKQAYAQFAEQNAQWVLRPNFFTVRAGDNPHGLPAVFDLKAEEEERQRSEGENRRGQRPGGATGGRPGGGAGSGGRGLAMGGGQPGGINVASAPAAQDNSRLQQQAERQRAGRRGGEEEDEVQPTFNPSARSAPLEGWAWDVDCIPGETYRYRAFYAIRNPLFAADAGAGADPAAAAENPQLRQQLALHSPEASTEWGPEITVEPLSYFFVTSRAAGGENISFTVFRWQQGKWQREVFKISPGDAIGYLSNGVDFRTGRVLVDIREDPGTGQQFALIVDAEGRFTRRTADDANSELLRSLERTIQSQEEEEEVADGR